MQRRLAARCALAEAALAEREQEVSALRTLLRQSRAAKAWKVRELEHESELLNAQAEVAKRELEHESALELSLIHI